MSEAMTQQTAAGDTRTATGARRFLGRMSRQPTTIAATGFLVLLVFLAIAAPLVTAYDPVKPDYVNILSGPSWAHPLGTDDYGRDVLTRLIYGARIALAVAVGSVAVAVLIGVPLGLILGFRGGWTDRLGTRFIDILDALPGTLVAFAVIAVLGRGLAPMMLAIGLIFCMNVARMTRAVTIAERSKLYIDAARVSGLREAAIVFKHVLPNLVAPLVVQAAILMGAAIGIESALSFLGIGLETNISSWGGALSVAADKQWLQPLLPFPPGIAIILTVLSLNMLADGFNDALIGDRPRARPAPRKSVQAPAIGATAAEGTVAPADPQNMLEIRDANIVIDLPAGGTLPVVRNVSLAVKRGEVLGLLGESGSGKSTLARAVLGLLPTPLRLESGAIFVDGRSLAGLDEKAMSGVRGRVMGAVFQDPMGSLSPVHTIGRQLIDVLRANTGLSKAEAREKAVDLLDRVGVRDARARLRHYPHQFSGGMAQRVAIARALAGSPGLLIADEPTSALDVTTQAQVLDLLLDLRDEYGMAILIITHDLGVVAEVCDRVAVMYQGEIVEVSTVDALFEAPKHPYTAALLSAAPRPRIKGKP